MTVFCLLVAKESIIDFAGCWLFPSSWLGRESPLVPTSLPAICSGQYGGMYVWKRAGENNVVCYFETCLLPYTYKHIQMYIAKITLNGMEVHSTPWQHIISSYFYNIELIYSVSNYLHIATYNISLSIFFQVNFVQWVCFTFCHLLCNSISNNRRCMIASHPHTDKQIVLQ